VTVWRPEEMVAGLLDRRFDLALILAPVSGAQPSLISPLLTEECSPCAPSNKTRWEGAGTCRSLRASETRPRPILALPEAKPHVRMVIDRFSTSLRA